MVGLNMFSKWPSIRRNTPDPVARGTVTLDKANTRRSTVLDSPLGQGRARRSDPRRVADLLSQLVTEIEGRPLDDWIPLAQGIVSIIGLTAGNLLAFDEFLGSFIGTVLENGRTVEPGSVTSPADSISANRRQLAAGSLGVTRTEVQAGRPASRRKFDELMVLFSEGKTLAAVLGDGDDGLPPGVSEIVNGMLVAIKNNLKSGDPAAARVAGADAATLIVAVHETFFTEATAGKASRSRGGRVARAHTAGLSGPVRVRKMPLSSSVTSRAIVKDFEFLGTGKKSLIDPNTGKPARRRTGKPASARKG